VIRNLRELYQYRALLWSLSIRELRARYRASVLGFLWTFLNPTLNMLIYVVVFGVLMQQRQEVPQYPYFMFCGLLPWIYFSTSVMGGTTSVSDRKDLLTKVRFPAQVLPATVVLTNLVNYLLSLPLLLLMAAAYRHWPTWHLVFFIPLLAVQTLFTLALTYLLSALNVAFRDLQHIVVNLVQMAFFATPVLWPIRHHLHGWHFTLALYGNPLAAIILAYQDIFYEQRMPDPAPLLSVTALSIVMLAISSVVFERRREEFAELV